MESEDFQKFLLANNNKYTVTEIQKICKCGKTRIDAYRKKLGLKNTNKEDRRKYRVNDQFLDKVGPEQSYFLGFFMSDGYLSSNSNENIVSFTLSVKDITFNLCTFGS